MIDDVSDVIQVLNRYGLAIDARRWEMFDEVFAPHCDVAYPDGQTWRDRDRFKQDFAAQHAPCEHTQHAMMNHVVSVAGDTASAFTYVHWRLVVQDAEAVTTREGDGFYDDTLIRTVQGWRISRRVCRVTRVRMTVEDVLSIPAHESGLTVTQVRDAASAGGIAVLSAGPSRRPCAG